MRNKVLIVDDININRIMLAEILSGKYETIEAENGLLALNLVERHKDELAVILLDLNMPVMNGFEVLEELGEMKLRDKIPVLVISGDVSVASESKCLDYGVADFIHKPFDENIISRRVSNVVDLFSYKNMLEEKVAAQTEILSRQNARLREQAVMLEQKHRNIIDVLGTVVESRNLESGVHIQRVKGYTRLLAERVMKDYPEYNLTSRFIDVMVPASALHDVGKIAIKDSILLKPGKLTSEEFEQMKEHTTKGCEILENIEGAWNEEYKRVSYDICRYHHERYDGRGYPDGLSGDDIPISAQIVAVADVYDALTTKRVYKDAYAKEKAYSMIMNGECGVFSPKLMDVLRKVRQEMEELEYAEGMH